MPDVGHQDLPTRPWQGRLPNGTHKGLPQGRSGSVLGTGARSGPDKEDPGAPEVHQGVVSQEEVPQDEGGCHRHSEEFQVRIGKFM